MMALSITASRAKAMAGAHAPAQPTSGTCRDHSVNAAVNTFDVEVNGDYAKNPVSRDRKYVPRETFDDKATQKYEFNLPTKRRLSLSLAFPRASDHTKAT
jgi:hypothetical protein